LKLNVVDDSKDNTYTIMFCCDSMLRVSSAYQLKQWLECKHNNDEFSELAAV